MSCDRLAWDFARCGEEESPPPLAALRTPSGRAQPRRASVGTSQTGHPPAGSRSQSRATGMAASKSLPAAAAAGRHATATSATVSVRTHRVLLVRPAPVKVSMTCSRVRLGRRGGLLQPAQGAARGNAMQPGRLRWRRTPPVGLGGVPAALWRRARYSPCCTTACLLTASTRLTGRHAKPVQASGASASVFRAA